jgi:hypothetical protein
MYKNLTSSLKCIVLLSALLFSGNYCLAKVCGKTKPKEKNKIEKPAINPVVDTITMVSGNLAITLDTVQDNIINQYPVTIKFKLNYAIAHKIKAVILIEPLQTLQNIKLYKDDSDTITFDQSDWAAKAADSTIKRTINLSLQQQKLVINEQNIVLHLQNIKPNFVVRLMPFAGKSKTAGKTDTTHLIPLGYAEIVDNGKVGITRDYTSEASSSIDTLTLTVRLRGKYDKNHNQLVFEFLKSSLTSNFQIMENPLTITQTEWNDAGRNARIKVDSVKVNTITGIKWKRDTLRDTLISIPLHINTIKITDSLNNIHNLDVVIKGQQQSHRGAQRIKVSIQDKPFWAELGTNFDLLDNIKTNNFYAGVYMFDKDIARIGGTKGVNNVSFTGGVYESQSISTRTTSSAGFAYRDLKSVHRDTGTVSSNTSVKSIGILFSPHWKLTKGKTDANGFHWFFSFYTELLWQTVTTGFSYPKTGKDSIIANASLPMNISNYPYKENSVSYDFRSHYQGFGFPLYIKENEFNLYVNPVIGLSSQQFYISAYKPNQNSQSPLPDPLSYNYVTNLTFLSPKNSWNGFFLFQFRLNEVAYGITFSGEIRELMLQNAKPIVTLALSKKFDLSQVLKPIVGKF